MFRVGELWQHTVFKAAADKSFQYHAGGSFTMVARVTVDIKNKGDPS